MKILFRYHDYIVSNNLDIYAWIDPPFQISLSSYLLKHHHAVLIGCLLQVGAFISLYYSTTISPVFIFVVLGFCYSTVSPALMALVHILVGNPSLIGMGYGLSFCALNIGFGTVSINILAYFIVVVVPDFHFAFL